MIFETRTKIAEGGRIVIPNTIRRKLHLSVGDEIVLQVREDELYLTTSSRELHKLQTKVQQAMARQAQPFSLAEDLIHTRRSEAKDE